MRLATRLVAATVALTVTTLTLALAGLYVAVVSIQGTEFDEALLAEARQEAEQAAAVGGSRVVIDTAPGPQSDLGEASQHALLLSSENSVVAADAATSPPLGTAELRRVPVGPPLDVTIGRERLRAVRVPLPGRPDLHILVASRTAALERGARFLAQASLAVLTIGVVVSALLARSVVRRLTRDHQAIAAVVRKVADGDLSARVGLANASDQDIRQLADDIDDMVERLAQLVSTRQQFIAHAAHELRSPLTTLYGELSLAVRRKRSAESYRELIEAALAQTRRLKLLADDLLTLARLESGEVAAVGEFDLASAIDGGAAGAEWIFTERQVVLKRPPSTWRIRGTLPDAERVFRNLFENAARHAPVGGSVRVSTVRQGPNVAIDVCDDGPGVPPDEVDHIFEPFYRGSAQPSGSAGAGLGLAIARQLARQHGGDVSFVAVPTGACFRVQLLVCV